VFGLEGARDDGGVIQTNINIYIYIIALFLSFHCQSRYLCESMFICDLALVCVSVIGWNEPIR
jgi:hypothetical protein